MADKKVDELPMADRDVTSVPAHWMFARLGKKVLRPGGVEITRWLLQQGALPGARVIELAPGLGATASLILEYEPATYTAIETQPEAAQAVEKIAGSAGMVYMSSAEATGLETACADVVVGEAMLSMQTEGSKKRIVGEASRILAPGGRYLIHELGLRPDSIPEVTTEELRKELARALNVNARPLTVAQWQNLLENEGFTVVASTTTPMALLEPRRLLADEGFGVLRIALNLAKDRKARKRVLRLRRLFRKHSEVLCGIGIIAEKKTEAS